MDPLNFIIPELHILLKKSWLSTQVAAHRRFICIQNAILRNDQVASHTVYMYIYIYNYIYIYIIADYRHLYIADYNTFCITAT